MRDSTNAAVSDGEKPPIARLRESEAEIVASPLPATGVDVIDRPILGCGRRSVEEVLQFAAELGLREEVVSKRDGRLLAGDPVLEHLVTLVEEDRAERVGRGLGHAGSTCRRPRRFGGAGERRRALTVRDRRVRATQADCNGGSGYCRVGAMPVCDRYDGRLARGTPPGSEATGRREELRCGTASFAGRIQTVLDADAKVAGVDRGIEGQDELPVGADRVDRADRPGLDEDRGGTRLIDVEREGVVHREVGPREAERPVVDVVHDDSTGVHADALGRDAGAGADEAAGVVDDVDPDVVAIGGQRSTVMGMASEPGSSDGSGVGWTGALGGGVTAGGFDAGGVVGARNPPRRCRHPP